MASNAKVIVFDNRGAGRTDKPDVPYSIEVMAEDTAELMKALAIERASLLGISMGGKIALDLALTSPRSCIQPASVPEQAPPATLRLSSTTPGIG